MRRRRPRFWVLMGTSGVTIVAFALILGNVHHSPFDFLERLHPQRLSIDLAHPPLGIQRFLYSGPGYPGKPVEKASILIFPHARADEVLNLLKSELRPETGFTATDVWGSGAGGRFPAFSESCWEFHDRNDGMPMNRVTFREGFNALPEENEATHPADSGAMLQVFGQKGCYVITVEVEKAKGNWLARQVLALKRLLHLA